MAKTGQPAYDAGMRGKEKPKEEPKGKTPTSGDKHPLKRITIEAADTGHIVEAHRHEPPPKKDGKGNVTMPSYDSLIERHAHNDPEAAKAHVNELMGRLTTRPEGKK